MKVFVAFATASLLIVSCAWAAPSVQDNRIEGENGGTLALAARYLGNCFETEDITTCLAVKGITALNRAARSNNIEIVSGISFKRDSSSPMARSGKALSENDIYAQLPENSEERSGRLVDIAVQNAAEFLGSHSLEMKIPAEATQEMARALDEGRGKLKKMLGPIALAIGAKLFTVVPLVLGALALLTTKAVIVAKIALLLALLVSGSRFFGGLGNKFSGALGGGYNAASWSPSNTAGWSSGAASSYPYARSLDAQQLAYAGQAPAEEEQQLAQEQQ
ncbi:PREDICTED: uncharacterized protein LOC108379472 [Rhagoletis zephyria]|uniref:uncharacterized protein LOC108379472 n=1 Tax=Rhagoletis zephyria TaxID=28612 RepID=UPI0008114454|nr:PREDICTED: uncharacterized protein LOC108379472 [Rhagoletis zephyria]